MRLFNQPGDYWAYLQLLAEGQRRTSSVDCFAHCLMPNHFHLVMRSNVDGDISRLMFWVSTTHAKRWHRRHGTDGTGPIYQGRFKSFPVKTDHHFLCVCRYVERNPVRAGLVGRAEEWKWSSCSQRFDGMGPIRLTDWPVAAPPDWLTLLAEQNPAETEQIRKSVHRSAPFGPSDWSKCLSALLDGGKSVRAIGRPRKKDAGGPFLEG